jgi:hypothetical protein
MLEPSSPNGDNSGFYAILLYGTNLQTIGFDTNPGEQLITHSGVLALDAVEWFYIIEAPMRQLGEEKHRWRCSWS